MKKRIFAYLLGLFILALGITLLKKAQLGISPESSVPAAVSNITPFTFGTMTMAFHVLSFLLVVLLDRKVELKTVMLLPLAVLFGQIIDFCGWLLQFGEMALWLRFASCFAGISLTALGIDVIVGAKLLLPGPDAFMHAASVHFGTPLGTVKIMGDAACVTAAVAIELLSGGKIVSIGVGTLFSMYLTGKLVTLFKKWLPWLEVKPAASE